MCSIWLPEPDPAGAVSRAGSASFRSVLATRLRVAWRFLRALATDLQAGRGPNRCAAATVGDRKGPAVPVDCRRIPRIAVVYRPVFMPCSSVCRSCIGLCFFVFERMAPVYRCRTIVAMGGQGDEDLRVSVRHTLDPTTAGPRLGPQVPQRAGHGAVWHSRRVTASGVEPKAGPAGRIGDSRCMKDRKIDAGEAGGSEPPRRLSGRRCGAHCVRQ